MRKNKKISFVFAFLLLSFSYPSKAIVLNNESKSITKITFNLKTGSQLFISFPLSIAETKEMILYEIKKDTTITLDIYSETPFTLLNLNKQNTQFVFFPNFSYSIEIKKNQIDFDFNCADKFKQFECNVLSKMENSVGKLNISEEDGDKVFNKLIKEKKYTQELDSFYIGRKNSRINELIKLKSENRISPNGYEVLTKYIECSFIKNRLMPLYYGNFERNYFPDWYKDTMLQYSKYFDDTTLINTKSFKWALRYMDIFLAKVKKGSNTVDAQFSIAKKISNVDIVNDLSMFYVLDDQANKKEGNYSDYVDSFKLYSKKEQFKSIIIENFNYSKIKGKNINNLLVNDNNETISFDTLIRKNVKVLIVDFWATWCAPCVKELSTINNSINEFSGKDVSYMFVSMDKDFGRWKKSITYYPFMNNMNSYILKDNFESDLAKSNFIKSIPFYFIYNNGTLIKSGVGEIQTPELKALITQLLNK